VVVWRLFQGVDFIRECKSLGCDSGVTKENGFRKMATASIRIYCGSNDAPIEIFIDLIRYIRTETGKSVVALEEFDVILARRFVSIFACPA